MTDATALTAAVIAFLNVLPTVVSVLAGLASIVYLGVQTAYTISKWKAHRAAVAKANRLIPDPLYSDKPPVAEPVDRDWHR